MTRDKAVRAHESGRSIVRGVCALALGLVAVFGMSDVVSARQASRPEVDIASPGDDSTVTSARVLFSGNASDDEALERVELVISAADAQSEFAAGVDELTSTLSTSGAQASWGVQLVIPNGSFRATATALDADGNRSLASIVDFTVNAADGRDLTPPDVVIEPFGDLRAGTVIADSAVSFRGTAIDTSSVAEVEVGVTRGSQFIRSDGSVSASVVTYEAALDPRTGPRVRWFQAYRLDPGSYQVTVSATDSEGNKTRDVVRNFRVDDPDVARDAFGDDELDIVPEGQPSAAVSATISVSEGDVITEEQSALIGTATSPVGVSSVALVIRNLDSGSFVDMAGRSVATSSSVEADVLQPGSETTSWLGSTMLPDGRYEVDLRVTDLGGGIGGLTTPVRFEVAPGAVAGQDAATTTSSIPVFRPTTTIMSLTTTTTTTPPPTTTTTTEPTTTSSSLDAATSTSTSEAEVALNAPTDGPRWVTWLIVLALVAFVIVTALGIMVWAFARSRARF